MPLVKNKEEQEIRPTQQRQYGGRGGGGINMIPKVKGESHDGVDLINSHRRNCLIAVPKYHEQLYSKLQGYHDWLTSGTEGRHDIGQHWKKNVNTPEDLKILNKLISDLRTVKSELFIDFTFHRKPRNLPIRDYINEFLRVKGVFNYYTFITWYRVTVHPESGDPDCQELETYEDKDGNKKQEYPKKEYLIIPLYIRLKKNKVYDQFKSIHYLNDSGTEYEVKPVNAQHFLRDDSELSRDKDEKGKIKYEDNYTSKKLTRYDKLEQQVEEETEEDTEIELSKYDEKDYGAESDSI